MNQSLNPYARWTVRWWIAALNPRNYWRQLRWSWQRATRGWADCDVWDMSGHLCSVIIPMLQCLQHRPGTPGVFIPAPSTMPYDPDDEDTNNALVAKGRAAWLAALDEMIAGFQAAAAINDGPPKQFFTKRDPALIAAERAQAKADAQFRHTTRWVSELDFDRDGYHAWEVEQRALQARGMQLFVDHFHSLWD